MIIKIILFLVIVIGGLVLYAATRPDAFRIQRSADVLASPDAVFALINDLHRWPEWSPWDKIDPAMVKTYSGPATGVGSAFAWDGNSKAGAGRSEIVESVAPSLVRLSLQMLRPFPAQNRVTFTIEPRGNGTHVSWMMEGTSPFMHKLIGLFMNFDKLVGKDFEAGLASLKGIVEKP